MKKENKKRLTKELLKEWQRTHYQEYCDFSDMMHVEKAREFDPFGHAGLPPSGIIRLTPSGKIKMTPVDDTAGEFFL